MIRCFRYFALFAICLMVATSSANADAFLKATTVDGARQLQTKSVHYTHPSGVRLTLLTTVHVAEVSYFDQIGQRMREADCVVYEGVVRRERAPLARFDFAETLNLVTQTSRLEHRGEKSALGDMTERQFEALRVPSIPIAAPPVTRQAFAEGLLRLETDLTTRDFTHRAFAIVDRNTAALTTLRHRLARGDQRIVLLYGVAHAADLNARLKAEFGFEPKAIEWLNAFTF